MAYDVFGVNGGSTTTTAAPTYKTNSSTKNAGSNYDVFGIGSVQAVANPNKPTTKQTTQKTSTPKPSTSLFSKVVRGAKTVADAATQGEQKLSTGVARILPGGSNDLKAENASAKVDEQNAQTYAQLHAQGKMTDAQYKNATQTEAKQSASNQKAVTATEKSMPSRAEIALGAASTAADIATAGMFSRAKEGALLAKPALIKSKELIPLIDTATKAGKVASTATQFASNATAGGLNAAAGGGTKEDIIKNAAAGAFFPEVLHHTTDIVHIGASKAADKLNIGNGTVARQTLQNTKVSSLLDKVRPPESSLPVEPTTTPHLNSIPNAVAEQAKTAAGEHDVLNPPTAKIGDDRSNLVAAPELTAKDKLAQTTEAAKIGALSKDDTPTTLLPSQTKDLPEIGGYTHSSDLVKDYASMLKETDKAPKVEGAKPVDYTAEAKKELAGGTAKHGASAEYKQLVDREAVPVADTTPKAAMITEPTTTHAVVDPNAPPERGTSKVALSIQEQAVKRGLTNDYGGAGGYDKINIEDQARKAVKLTQDRPALDEVINGTKPLPDGLRATALIRAIEEDPVLGKDHELINKLSKAEHLTGESSRSAQELRLAKERNPNSPTEAIRNVRKAREAAVERKTGKTVAKATSDEVKAIRAAKATVPKPTKETFSSFVESLKC